MSSPGPSSLIWLSKPIHSAGSPVSKSFGPTFLICSGLASGLTFQIITVYNKSTSVVKFILSVARTPDIPDYYRITGLLYDAA